MSDEIKFTTRSNFMDWIYENRFNKDVSDEEFSTIIELNCLRFKGETKTITGFIFSSEQMDKIRLFVAAGEKLQAVKFIKEQSGMGLKESKEYFDNLVL
jgi:hypothetical protein